MAANAESSVHPTLPMSLSPRAGLRPRRKTVDRAVDKWQAGQWVGGTFNPLRHPAAPSSQLGEQALKSKGHVPRVYRVRFACTR